MVKPSPNPIITSNSAKSHLWSQIKTKNIRNPHKIFEISKVSTLIRKLSKAQLLTLPELGERSIRKKKPFFFFGIVWRPGEAPLNKKQSKTKCLFFFKNWLVLMIAGHCNTTPVAQHQSDTPFLHVHFEDWTAIDKSDTFCLNSSEIVLRDWRNCSTVVATFC